MIKVKKRFHQGIHGETDCYEMCQYPDHCYTYYKFRIWGTYLSVTSLRPLMIH